MTPLTEIEELGDQESTSAMPDPGTAHPQNLLGRRVRIDFGKREDVGEIRNVSDDIERGRELHLRITTHTGTRIAVVNPAAYDLEVQPAGGDA